MKTQEELWAEYERLKEAELYEEAGKVLDLIEPISDDEWRRRLEAAPMDDEPVSPELERRFAELEAVLASASNRRAG